MSASGDAERLSDSPVGWDSDPVFTPAAGSESGATRLPYNLPIIIIIIIIIIIPHHHHHHHHHHPSSFKQNPPDQPDG